MNHYHSAVDKKIESLRKLIEQLDALEPLAPPARVNGKWVHRAGRHTQYLNI